MKTLCKASAWLNQCTAAWVVAPFMHAFFALAYNLPYAAAPFLHMYIVLYTHSFRYMYILPFCRRNSHVAEYYGSLTNSFSNTQHYTSTQSLFFLTFRLRKLIKHCPLGVDKTYFYYVPTHTCGLKYHKILNIKNHLFIISSPRHPVYNTIYYQTTRFSDIDSPKINYIIYGQGHQIAGWGPVDELYQLLSGRLGIYFLIHIFYYYDQFFMTFSLIFNLFEQTRTTLNFDDRAPNIFLNS